MAKGDIKLSPEHGLNPSILVCPVCLEEGSIALLGKLPGDKQAPRRMLDNGPCEKCQEHMKVGIIIVGCDPLKVQDGDSDRKIYGYETVTARKIYGYETMTARTGYIAVVKDRFFEESGADQQLIEDVLKKRVTFMDHNLMVQLFGDPSEAG